MFDPINIFLIIGGLVVLFGIYVLFHKKKRLGKRVVQEIEYYWREIESLAGDHPEQAVLKADKLLDFALKNAGFSGSLGEKLKASRAVWSDNDGLWSAHKLRNRIAHEIKIQVSPTHIRAALSAYRKALGDLGVTI